MIYEVREKQVMLDRNLENDMVIYVFFLFLVSRHQKVIS